MHNQHQSRACSQRNRRLSGEVRRALVVALVILSAMCALPIPGLSQAHRWEYFDLTRFGYDRILPRVSFDAWGNVHAIFATENPRRSGKQLFYIEDGAGRFGAPIQATDTGVILDSSGARITPYVFRLDQQSTVHLAFAANVSNRYGLYYVANDNHFFPQATLLTRLFAYDMAVDSSGGAHVVWIDTTHAVAELYHWSSKSGKGPELVSYINCFIPTIGCRIGAPEVEVQGGRIVVAFRSDTGSVYVTSWPVGGVFSPIVRLAAPAWPRVPGIGATADLRLRMAVDAGGIARILLPTVDSTGARRMMSITTGPNGTSWSYIGPQLDAYPDDFEIQFDGTSKHVTLWTTGLIAPPINLPSNNLGEISSSGSFSILGDPGVLTRPPQTERRYGTGLALYGDRIAIPVVRPAPSDSATIQTGLFVRTSVRPILRYLLPDAAPPGMNVVVDAFAAPREFGAFGPDGFRGDSVSLELVNAADVGRIVVGPSVVSWNGRLVSTMIFVRPGATPGPVPLRIRVDGVAGSVDTFFVVTPTSFGDNGVVSGGGLFTTGRSKRGVLVVDSLILRNGTYGFDTVDCDPIAPGNQAFLPVTLLSLGPVIIDSTATLSVSARHDSAARRFGIGGPGGGGGGTGAEFVGGPGFTGGGGVVKGANPLLFALSTGSGGDRSSFWNGGRALGGAGGGGTQVDVPGGGGTAHPFGASGLAGQGAPTLPIALHPGGYGGGSGGGKALLSADETSGGGGGGNAFPGEGGGDLRSSNGGLVVGNRMLIPLAGGSGGGGGGFASGGYGNGGGGGGGIAIVSNGGIRIDGSIQANGASGVNASVADNASGGGGGAGGGIHLSAKQGVVVGPRGHVVAAGGIGAPGNRRIGLLGKDGGSGGAGRVRIDGRVTSAGDFIVAGSTYSAAATASSTQISSQTGTVIRGVGMPGAVVRLYSRPESAARWSYSTYKQASVGIDSSWSVTLGPEAGEGRLFLVAMQQVASPSIDPFTTEPRWVMSAASGNMLGRPAITVGIDTIRFACIQYSDCDSSTVVVTNTGFQADLVLRSFRFTGSGASRFAVRPSSMAIPAGASRAISVVFCPGDTGRFEADLLISTNLFPDSIRRVHLIGCAISGTASVPQSIDLGELCIGACRDVTIPVLNTGTGMLRVTDVLSAVPTELGTTLLSPSLPAFIQPGGELSLQVRLCPRRFQPQTMQLVIRTDGLDAESVVIVHARNAGPAPDIPSIVDFGTVDLGSDDSCIVQTVAIGNRSLDRSLTVRLVELLSRRFRMLDSVSPGTVIPPGGRVVLRVGFCADSAGAFAGRLHLLFGGDDCNVDTAVDLKGAATLRRGILIVSRPIPKQLIFSPVAVGTTTTSRKIVVRNIGTTVAGLQIPVRRPLGTTTDAEILLDDHAVPFPHDVLPGDSVVLDISLRPAAESAVEGEILLASTDGDWRDTIRLYGRGVKPGLYISLPRVDFGAVRVGDSATTGIDIGNNGSAPVRLLEIRVDDTVHFKVNLTTLSLPMDLESGGAPHLLPIQFRPDGEGVFSTTLHVVAQSDTQTATLVGVGGLEHVAVTPGGIDFGCRPPKPVDSIDVLVVRNTGTWALRVDSITIAGDSEFSMGPESWPHAIPPGGRKLYTVRFTPDSPVSVASVVIHSSAKEQVDVRLTGRRCDLPEILSMTLFMPRASGQVGNSTTIPIRARLNRAADREVDYDVRVEYDPLVMALPRGSVAATSGTLSTTAALSEVSPGILRIKGTIGVGLMSDTLIAFPVLPLLGPARVTPLRSTFAFWTASGPLSVADTGTFTVLDCDPNGTVTIGDRYALRQNRPNPFNPSTVIEFSMAFRERARLVLYNSMGNPIRTLIDATLPSGWHEYRLDAGGLPSGVYYYELRAGRFRSMLRMVLLD